MKEMNILNDDNSSIYKITLEKQKTYIQTRISKIQNRYLADNCGLSGDKKDIANHLNKGPAQNLVQTFFKTDKICCNCGLKKGENEIRQLERAHCNKYSRFDLLILALDELYIDENTPVPSGKILKKFIEKHELCPIYTLCNICHNQYDNHT
jgi:hypothetical protein